MVMDTIGRPYDVLPGRYLMPYEYPPMRRRRSPNPIQMVRFIPFYC